MWVCLCMHTYIGRWFVLHWGFDTCFDRCCEQVKLSINNEGRWFSSIEDAILVSIGVVSRCHFIHGCDLPYLVICIFFYFQFLQFIIFEEGDQVITPFNKINAYWHLVRNHIEGEWIIWGEGYGMHVFMQWGLWHIIKLWCKVFVFDCFEYFLKR